MKTKRERLIEILDKYLARQDRSISWLARELELHPATVTRWAGGHSYPSKPDYFAAMIDLLNIDEKADRDFMLRAAGLEVPTQESTRSASSSVAPDAANESPAANPSPSTSTWPATIARYLQQCLKQSDEAWEVRAIHLLQVGMERMSAVRLLRVLLPPAAWWFTGWLVTPMLRWPLPEMALAQTAGIKFGIATLLAPLLITVFLILQPPLEPETSAVSSRSSRFLFQLTGALVGFVSVAVIATGIGLCWFYLRGSPLPQGVGWGLVLLPIVSGYVVGRAVPVLRGRSEQRCLFGKGDALVLLVFLLFGPAAAFFFYGERTMLQEQTFGVMLLVALLAWIVWEARDRLPQPLSILLLGVVTPGLVLCLPLWMPGAAGAPHVNPQTLLLFTGYTIGQCTVIFTLYVRGKAKLNWSILIFLLIMELLTLLVLTYDAALGLRFVAGLGVLMLVLGLLGQLPSLRQYLYVHPSFWAMQLVFMASIWAWGTTLGWTSILFYGGATVGLVAWAGDIRPRFAARLPNRLSTG